MFFGNAYGSLHSWSTLTKPISTGTNLVWWGQGRNLSMRSQENLQEQFIGMAPCALGPNLGQTRVSWESSLKCESGVSYLWFCDL